MAPAPFLLILLWASPAWGQGCIKRVDQLRYLAQSFDEQIMGRGINVDGRVIELTVSPTGSWTIIITWNGCTKVGAQGENWSPAPSPKDPRA